MSGCGGVPLACLFGIRTVDSGLAQFVVLLMISVCLQTMDALFPDMPVNAGLEKALAVVSNGVAKAAQTLVSLSFLILPVSLAVGIKLFQWLGPFAAAAAVLIPLAALFNAESILGERAILPLSGEVLAPYTTGKAVRDLAFFFPFLQLSCGMYHLSAWKHACCNSGLEAGCHGVGTCGSWNAKYRMQKHTCALVDCVYAGIR